MEYTTVKKLKNQGICFAKYLLDNETKGTTKLFGKNCEKMRSARILLKKLI